MRRRLLGDETDDTFISSALHNLARELESKGELFEAEKLYQESLAMDQRLFIESADSYGHRGNHGQIG